MKNQLGIATWFMLLALLMIQSSYAIPMDVGTTSTPASYSASLLAIRTAAKDPTRAFFGIPMLPKPPSPITYLTVELKSVSTITLALDKRNLYIVGYSDTLTNGTVRAFFFNDAPANAKTVLFPTAKGTSFRTTLSYGGSYAQLEGKAGATRMKLGLGIDKLANRVDKVAGIAVNVDKTQAELLLIAVQMISEATRFVYIENQVRTNFELFEFTQDYKVISLENEWGKISAKIRAADIKTGVINPPIAIVNATNFPVSVNLVSTIKPDIGILNYVA